MDIKKILCEQFSLTASQYDNTVGLIDDGNTIPFIARYRKEVTGSLDDQVLRELYDRLQYLRNLDSRRSEILATIGEQGNLTDELAAAINSAETLAALEDLYRPFKPKRKTRGSVARARGLEPLAHLILTDTADALPIDLAAPFVDAEKEVPTADDAVAGALDIIAENLSDNPEIRGRLRELYFLEGIVLSKAAKKEDSVYSGYYDYKEPVKKIAGHRILAINRGEKEDFLRVSVEVPEDKALRTVRWGVLKILPEGAKPMRGDSPCGKAVKTAASDSYSRLIHPSMEREIRGSISETAAESAIKVFGQNLRQLLLQPPVKGKTAMGVDPGFRTGCKVAVVDPTGKVLDTGVIYPTQPHNKIEQAAKIITDYIKKHQVEIIAIGNGTASRETESFIADTISPLQGVAYAVVSEAGASVYSASKLAAKEFPEYDVSLRSAVSIARRLQDPLAELIKIDPKSIGVGQYQHDMPEKRMSEALDGVVESCVNSVGADLNTASEPLLCRIAGISPAIAKSIIAYREEKGAFVKRSELKKVPRLGPKAFEQCAGFLRIPAGKEILDNTAVHPESYESAKMLLTLCGYDLKDVAGGSLPELNARIAVAGEEDIANRLSIGIPTLHDITAELLRPGRDVRDALPPPILRTGYMDMKDLKPGMELTGTVRNVIDFGAFIDIGVHEDGLVHISQICDRFIKHPSEVLKVGDIVKVWVISVESAKKRISLTMLQRPAPSNKN